MVKLNLNIFVAMLVLLPFYSLADNQDVNDNNNSTVNNSTVNNEKRYLTEQQEELYRLEMERLLQQELEAGLIAPPCYFYPYCVQPNQAEQRN